MISVIYVIECLDLDTKKRTLANEFWTDLQVANSEVDALNFLYLQTDTHKLAFVRTLYNSDLREARTLKE